MPGELAIQRSMTTLCVASSCGGTSSGEIILVSVYRKAGGWQGVEGTGGGGTVSGMSPGLEWVAASALCCGQSSVEFPAPQEGAGQGGQQGRPFG